DTRQEGASAPSSFCAAAWRLAAPPGGRPAPPARAEERPGPLLLPVVQPEVPSSPEPGPFEAGSQGPFWAVALPERHGARKTATPRSQALRQASTERTCVRVSQYIVECSLRARYVPKEAQERTCPIYGFRRCLAGLHLQSVRGRAAPCGSKRMKLRRFSALGSFPVRPEPLGE